MISEEVTLDLEALDRGIQKTIKRPNGTPARLADFRVLLPAFNGWAEEKVWALIALESSFRGHVSEATGSSSAKGLFQGTDAWPEAVRSLDPKDHLPMARAMAKRYNITASSSLTYVYAMHNTGTGTAPPKYQDTTARFLEPTSVTRGKKRQYRLFGLFGVSVVAAGGSKIPVFDRFHFAKYLERTLNAIAPGSSITVTGLTDAVLRRDGRLTPVVGPTSFVSRRDLASSELVSSRKTSRGVTLYYSAADSRTIFGEHVGLTDSEIISRSRRGRSFGSSVYSEGRIYDAGDDEQPSLGPVFAPVIAPQLVFHSRGALLGADNRATTTSLAGLIKSSHSLVASLDPSYFDERIFTIASSHRSAMDQLVLGLVTSALSDRIGESFVLSLQRLMGRLSFRDSDFGKRSGPRDPTTVSWSSAYARATSLLEEELHRTFSTSTATSFPGVTAYAMAGLRRTVPSVLIGKLWFQSISTSSAGSILSHAGVPWPLSLAVTPVTPFSSVPVQAMFNSVLYQEARALTAPVTAPMPPVVLRSLENVTKVMTKVSSGDNRAR